ncbi:SDR family NAD(P)-dependent oxidoreductase [Labrys wisconsinensis]|uniref:3-oxoacyl-[acyl-carrier protein] reductase n=1 Tax=Labrys wisconsinensis TaxID=425677 RepID=A0ABU0J4P7_9HYPH|nr:SDR family oxidoreductase [Labrys wisconsinensis]MDQ0469240.1 3-oxoacyl-[acyl-carrier protein] reductase [Labrys wisconsinensis]
MSAPRPVAIVTGSSSGIGAAAARRLARAGFDVAVTYSRNADGARSTAAACKAEGAAAIVVRGDVSVDADCRAIAAAAAAAWGRIDVLVNNAGTTRYAEARDLDALDAADFQHVFGTNVTGAYQMARAAAPHLRAAPDAAIVNVSSHAGFSGAGSSTAYAASKGALNTLTLGLARALAPAIRVNAVCPGFVATDWGLAWQEPAEYEAFQRRAADVAPLRRIPTADGVAECIVWLATAAAFVTGQLLVIDGGTHLTVGSPLAQP